jgi:hypothetical protein
VTIRASAEQRAAGYDTVYGTIGRFRNRTSARNEPPRVVYQPAELQRALLVSVSWGPNRGARAAGARPRLRVPSYSSRQITGSNDAAVAVL